MGDGGEICTVSRKDKDTFSIYLLCLFKALGTFMFLKGLNSGWSGLVDESSQLLSLVPWTSTVGEDQLLKQSSDLHTWAWHMHFSSQRIHMKWRTKPELCRKRKCLKLYYKARAAQLVECTLASWGPDSILSISRMRWRRAQRLGAKLLSLVPCVAMSLRLLHEILSQCTTKNVIKTEHKRFIPLMKVGCVVGRNHTLH